MIHGKKIATRLEVSLVRFTGGSEGWLLRVTDDASSELVLEAELSWAEFGRMVGNNVNVAGVVYQSERLGLRMEVKTIYVPITTDEYRARDMPESFWARADEIAGEGWRVERERANPHRYRDGKYTVTARRWVQP